MASCASFAGNSGKARPSAARGQNRNLRPQLRRKLLPDKRLGDNLYILSTPARPQRRWLLFKPHSLQGILDSVAHVLYRRWPNFKTPATGTILIATLSAFGMFFRGVKAPKESYLRATPDLRRHPPLVEDPCAPAFAPRSHGRPMQPRSSRAVASTVRSIGPR